MNHMYGKVEVLWLLERFPLNFANSLDSNTRSKALVLFVEEQTLRRNNSVLSAAVVSSGLSMASGYWSSPFCDCIEIVLMR